MKIATGTVTRGEGEKVNALQSPGRQRFRVSRDEKRLLLKSLAEADRGELIDADELFAELDQSN